MASPLLNTLNSTGGHFRVYVTAPGHKRKDVTFFRGAPTQIQSMSSTDPFGDAAASVSFPSITGMDRPGSGDLYWLVPWANLDIIFYDEDGFNTGWAWEGMMVSESIGDQYSVACKGALYQLDNFVAAPWYPQYPIPYEVLIKKALDPDSNPTLRTTKMRLEFPSDWKLKVPKFNDPTYLWFLRPWGVKTGANWSGLTTRNTGGWEPKLTGFVQSLLAVMYTDDGGQWTIYKDTGRSPVMRVRPALRYPDGKTLTVYYGTPAVTLNVSRDFSQSANVVFGSGTDLSGSSYSGMEVSSDGSTTYWEPFAAQPFVYPYTSKNPRLDKYVPRRETRLQLPNGMDQNTAREAAAAHLRRFADPGYVGTIELGADPLLGGQPFNRQLIKAGQTILVKNLRGTDVLFHISEASVSPMEGTCSLTVDTKFRDALTVAEVRARTRDALDPVRLLKVGGQSNIVEDMIKPWSYSNGSGILPSGGQFDATKLFTKLMPELERFPWTTTTKKYPPKKYPGFYIKLNPKNAVADKNWCGLTKDGKSVAAIPIKMSQQGTIRLSQVAAYDENGNVLPVRFHISLYTNSGVTVSSTPSIDVVGPNTGGYKAGEHYPFFPHAWEKYNDNGEVSKTGGRVVTDSAGLTVGWGNFYEGAGYSPGRSSIPGNPKTGLLTDETSWGFNTAVGTEIDPGSVKDTAKNKTAGQMYALIYCDDQGTKPVYFLGRFFRQEPGGNANG